MKQVTHISVLPPDHRANGFSLRGRLKQLARYLGVVTNAHSATAAIKHASGAPVPQPPDHHATHEPEANDAPDSFNLLGWLKHFVLYLGAVTIICLIGLYFLWQIPFLRDPSQLLRAMDDSRAPRHLATTAAPATPTIQATLSPPPVNTAAIPGQPPVPANAVVATTSSPTMPTDPAGAPLPLESQPAAVPDGQAEPVPPPTEATAEAVPPPTPQAEIEQLLANAQQQMDNRRFTAPASGNALSTYRRVLELQPNHPAAINGIQHIATYYLDVAQQSLQQGRMDESLAYISRGLRAAPKSDALLNLHRQVQKAKQREQEAQRQAALEEMQRQQLEQVQQEQLRRQQEQQPWWRQPSNHNDNSGFNQR